MNETAPRGKIYVFHAPSGGGKNTMCKFLTDELSNIQFSVSATTRPKRPGEKEGETYFFKTREEFEAMVRNGDFLEYAEVFGNYYGTPKPQVIQTLANGKDVIVEVDYQGYQALKEQFSDQVVGIYIDVNNPQTLRNRLLKREPEMDLENLERRMADYENRKEQGADYDHVVDNSQDDDGYSAFTQIKQIIEAERAKSAAALPATPEAPGTDTDEAHYQGLASHSLAEMARFV